MDEHEDLQVRELTNKAILSYYYLMISAICVVGAYSYWILRMEWIIWYTIALVFFHIAWLVIIIKSNFIVEKYFVAPYYIFIVVYLIPAVLILWQIQVYSIMLLYTLSPLMILFRFDNLKYTVQVSVFSFFIILAITIVSARVRLVHTHVNENIISYLNLFIIIAAMTFVIIFIYFKYTILKRKNELKTFTIKEEEVDNAQMKELYKSVIDYFAENQPYRQPNYRLAMLAADLNTNTKYLSIAINTYFGGNFESLINKYRLELVKKMLDENLAEKYTMEYIYTMAGYSSRATFYGNFRKTFNMSPADYLEFQKPKINLSKNVFP